VAGEDDEVEAELVTLTGARAVVEDGGGSSSVREQSGARERSGERRNGCIEGQV
jgi:hypothetical protein